ncbi:unnamed protein product [Effrenium voratum]|nr:unnamed protein product [Effrenium voratum]
MAVVTLRNLMDRWSEGEVAILELMEQSCHGLSQEGAEDEAIAVSLVEDARRLCRHCISGAGEERRVSSMAGSTPLLHRMLLHTSGETVPLQEELEAAALLLLHEVQRFQEALKQMGRALPSYALPFDMALAAAHACGVLQGLTIKEPSLTALLHDLAQPRVLAVEAQSAESEAFSFLIATLQRRAKQASDPRGTLTPAWDFALGDAVETLSGAEGRVLLVESGEVLLREASTGRMARAKTSELFRPGARQALATHRAVLGLGPAAGPQEATRAFRRLAKQHHPDKGGDPETFRSLHDAFQALTSTRDAPCTPPRSRARAGRAASETPSPLAPKRRLWRKTPREEAGLEVPSAKRARRASSSSKRQVARMHSTNDILKLIWLFAFGNVRYAKQSGR